MNVLILMGAGLLTLAGSTILATTLVIVSIELYRQARTKLVIIGSALLLIGLVMIASTIQTMQAAAALHAIY